MNTPRKVGVIAITSAALLAPLLLTMPTASAHQERGLDARVLTARAGCPPESSPFCLALGRIRVTNHRSRPAVVCVGIAVHTARHRNLSVEGRSRQGQARVRLRPRSTKVSTYEVVYTSGLGQAHHVEISHLHTGGRPC
jgi:hypothetical protein